ncbi:MAG: hypothetical protein ACE5GX_16945, partial [Thermoanaerobaculia bacterium]
MHVAQGSTEEAEAALRDVLLLDPAKKPTDITLASDLALYLAKSGNRAEAETELDNIAELESQPPDILYKAAVT